MVHLHTHSMFSLRDSIIRPEDLIERLKEIGQNTVAITDHGGSLGGVTLYQLLKKAGIRYIHGCEFYICSDVSVKDKDAKYYHLVALCKNEKGRKNLNKLISLSERPENRYFKPRIDFNLLSQYGDGLIVLSACLAGEVSRAILNDNIEEARQTAIHYRARFGEDYYLEVQSHNDPQQISVNREILKIAKQLGISCVVTTDAHYTREADRKYQAKYAFNGSYKEDGEAYIDCFVQSEQEVRDRLFYLDLDTIDELICNTHRVADKCQMEIPLSAPIMPRVDTPPEFKSNHDWLVSLCTDGFKRKLNIDPCTRSNASQCGMQHSRDTIDTYVDRYKYELNALDKMGFVDYILLVYSYASVGKRRGIARGSGGGSLINYLTDITNIDPIEHGLYFERFIDVSALSKLESGEITAKELKIPDIDLDFSKNSCDEVLKFLYEKYGEDKVASIGKFGTNQTRGTIRDMCKVLGIGLTDADQIAKSFENYEIDEIDRMIAGELPMSKSAKDAVEYVKQHPELFEYVRKLNGLPKSFGLHACFSGDTLITTDCGQVPISNIRIGDMVLTKSGDYRKVIQTSKLNSNRSVRLNVSGAPNTICTSDHLFLVRKRLHSRKRMFSDPMWVAASEIKKADVVAMAINRNSNIPNNDKLPVSSHDFWWIVGRYIGDGWLEQPKGRNEKRVVICCSKNGTSELDAICSHLDSAKLKYRTEKVATTYKIHILESEMYSFLLQFGKYAFGKHLTSTVQNLPKDLLEAFLVGYFSADGYVDRGGFQNFKTVSKKLAIDIKQAIAKVYNRHSGICEIPEKEDVICGRKVHSRIKYTCYFSQTKRNKERCFYDYPYIWSFVRSVDMLDQELDVYDLTVDKDASFIANGVVVHNCGKIVATQELDCFLPSCYDSNGIRYLQGDMHDVEDMGLVKIDVLGLRTLDAEYDTLEQSGEGAEFLNPKQDYSDEKVLNIFRKGDTVGIFQMASPGMKKTLKNMNVSGIEDLSAANALFRPGSIQYIDNYCQRKAGKEQFEYLHPDLEPILKSTYGIFVFQEQVIEIGRMAGLHNPDLLRKAIAKKKPDLLAEVHPELREKLLARGWSEGQFEKLWSDMLEFAHYSFNKSHSSAYAIIAYMTAKQKTYYPAEFYCGLCNSYIGKSDFVKNEASEIIGDMMRHKIRVAPPSFRDDHRRCNVKDGKVLWGIPLIRDCNISLGEALYDLRDTDQQHFWRIAKILWDKGMRSKVVILVKLGFFHEYGTAKELLRVLDIADLFKMGDRKSIKKSAVTGSSLLTDILKKYSSSTNAKGEELSTFKILDCSAILDECEDHIKTLNLGDFDDKAMILTQQEYIGALAMPTGKETDRKRVFVNSVFPLNRKSDGKLFGYNVAYTSIGSGVTNLMTVFSERFNKTPISPGDIILCKDWTKDRKGYFRMLDYEKCY